MIRKSRRKERRQFKFLNVKLLHNQSAENYIELFKRLLEADFVVETSNSRQIELLDFKVSDNSGVYEVVTLSGLIIKQSSVLLSLRSLKICVQI